MGLFEVLFAEQENEYEKKIFSSSLARNSHGFICGLGMYLKWKVKGCHKKGIYAYIGHLLQILP